MLRVPEPPKERRLPSGVWLTTVWLLGVCGSFSAVAMGFFYKRSLEERAAIQQENEALRAATAEAGERLRALQDELEKTQSELHAAKAAAQPPAAK